MSENAGCSKPDHGPECLGDIEEACFCLPGAPAHECSQGGYSWFREEYEKAKARNAAIPPHARMIVTSPTLSAHRRRGVR